MIYAIGGCYFPFPLRLGIIVYYFILFLDQVEQLFMAIEPLLRDKDGFVVPVDEDGRVIPASESFYDEQRLVAKVLF